MKELFDKIDEGLSKATPEGRAAINALSGRYGLSYTEAETYYRMGGNLHSDILCELSAMGVPDLAIKAINSGLWGEHHKTVDHCDSLGVRFDEGEYKKQVRKIVDNFIF